MANRVTCVHNQETCMHAPTALITKPVIQRFREAAESSVYVQSTTETGDWVVRDHVKRVKTAN